MEMIRRDPEMAIVERSEEIVVDSVEEPGDTRF